MEGSVATGAAEGAAGAAEGGQGAAEQQASGFDLSPVLERLDGLVPRMESIEQHFSQQQGAGQQVQQEEPAGVGDADLSGLFDIDSGLDPAAAQQLLQQVVDSRTQTQLDAALAPIMEQVRGIQTGLDAEQLAARYPALATEEGAKPVVDAARALAGQLGQPELVNNMRFIETIYKAQMADKYAAGEVPVGGEKSFELERAGGAGPQAGGDGKNIAERIVADRQKTEFWRGL